MPRVKSRMIARHYATPHPYDVVVYTKDSRYYAKDKNGRIICVNSDTACIQEAVDTLTPNRNWIETVLISSGVYEIYDTIKLDSYTRLVAYGAYLKLGDKVNKQIITNRDKTNGNRYIIIEGGIYDGNKENNPSVPISLIYFNNANLITVKDTVIKNSAIYGLSVDNTGVLRAFRNFFERNLGGVRLAGWDHLFMHNVYSYNTNVDVFLLAGSSAFIGEYFGSNAINNLSISGYGNNTIFAGCTISDALQYNILLYKLDTSVPNNNIFIGNRITQALDKSADNQYDLILIREGSDNLFVGNIIYSKAQTKKPKYLVEEQNTAGPNYFIENLLRGTYGTASANLSGIGSIYKFRGLITTENGGVAVLPANSTRVTVQHNMGIKPNKILLTPGANIKVWYENVTTTSFDIVTDTPPTADIYISWMAIL
jgi:hypothetical protein